MTKNIIIYHNNCSDGFTSAAIAAKYFTENNQIFELVPGVYGELPPDVTDANVYFLDFSYKKDQLLHLLKVAKQITLIDHHITAINDLKDLINNPPTNFAHVIDLKKSGAGLTWDYFYPNLKRPNLVDYVEDRDIWNWNLNKTHEYLMALELYDFTIESYILHLDKSLNDIYHTGDCIRTGTIVANYFDKIVDQIIQENLYYVTYGSSSKLIPIINCTGKFSSHVGNKLAKKHPTLFSVMYEIIGDEVRLSFRSVDTGQDVSVIAKELGGGGHRNASGAKIKLEEFYSIFNNHTK